MAINLCCPQCYKTYKLNTTLCKCGNNLRSNKRFKVRIKLPNGKWKSKQVGSLELAKKVEAKFKTQSVEQDVFNIHKAPVVDQVTPTTRNKIKKEVMINAIKNLYWGFIYLFFPIGIHNWPFY